ncbi:MAG: exosome complex exonuclease Rrp41 [Candidatus Woesearchaeota archaeon]
MAAKAVKQAYPKRHDGRKWEELRPIEGKVGVIPRADGSAMFRIGHTVAYAAVYGPRELHPKFMQNPGTGILRCRYNMMPFSGHGERVRPGGGRRSQEISMLMSKALMPVLDLKEYPNAVVDVFVELPETDAGTRCAAITAASMALADAGLQMKDLVVALSMGHYDGQIMADIDGYEDCEIGISDIPVAYIPTMDRFSLLQLDGEVPKEDLKKVLELAKKKAMEIYKVQQEALKAKFGAEILGKKVKS